MARPDVVEASDAAFSTDDIAEHYLGFMRGGYVTGQVLVVDGGGVLV